MNLTMDKPAKLFNRNFLLLWQGTTVSMAGSQVYMISLMLWMEAKTGSPSLMGMLLMVGGFAAFLGPIGGALSDRISRVKMLIVLDLLSGVVILSLSLIFLLMHQRTDLLVFSLFAAHIIRCACDAFFHPACTALVPDLVPPKRLSSANACLISTMGVATVVGRTIGGFLFAQVGAMILFMINGICYMLSAGSEIFIRTPSVKEKGSEPLRKVPKYLFQEVKEGIKFAVHQKGLKVYFIMAGFLHFLNTCYFVLMPFFFRETLMIENMKWFAYALAVTGLGAFIGTVVAGIFPVEGRSRSLLIISCLFLFSGLPSLPALLPYLEVVMAGNFIAGLAMGLYQVNMTTVLQNNPPAEMRGRIMGVQMMCRFGLIPLGLGVFGMLGELVKPHYYVIFLVCGVLMMILCLWGVSCREYRDFLATNAGNVKGLG